MKSAQWQPRERWLFALPLLVFVFPLTQAVRHDSPNVVLHSLYIITHLRQEREKARRQCTCSNLKQIAAAQKVQQPRK